MATPLPQDSFSRFAAGMFDEKEIIGVPTAGLMFFGDASGNSRTIYSPDANTVDIDIIRGEERIAALVPRGSFSDPLDTPHEKSETYSAFSRKYPLALRKGDIQSDKLLVRLPGEQAVNSSVTQTNRFRYHAGKIHMENVRRMIRLCEVLAWQSVMTGKQDAILGTSDTNLQYDFRRSSNLTIQCGTSWAGGSADILANIDNGCTKLRQLGHVTPDMAAFGSGAIASFIKDTTVRALADNRRFDFMSVGRGAAMAGKFQRFVDGGMIFQGNLRTPQGYELALFSYPEFYTATNGTATPYIATDKVLICSSTARADRYFGPSEGLPMVPQRAHLYSELFGFDPYAPMVPPNIKGGMARCCPQAAFYCQAYVSPDWKRVTIESQCAPIFATTQTDAFCVLDVEP